MSSLPARNSLPKKALLLALLLAVAAGGGLWYADRFGNGATHDAPPGAQALFSADLRGKRITVLTNPPHQRSSAILGQWFQEQTGAVVQNVVVNYEDMLRYTLDDIASGNPQLDVLLLWYAELGLLAQQGALADLTGFIADNAAAISPEDFLPGLYDPYTLYKGRRWAVPYDGDTHVLFYRTSLLKKYGFSPPATWEEYLDIARTITEKERDHGVYGAAIMGFRAPIILLSTYIDRLGSFGGELLDRSGRPQLDSPEAIAALAALVEQCRHALPTPLQTDFDVSRDAFLSGAVAMVEQWTDIGVMAEDPAQSVIRGDWGVVQTPRGPGPKGRSAPALNAGFSLGLSSRAPDPEVARAYLLYASLPEVTLRLNLINGGIDPVRISVLTSGEYRKFAPKVSAAAQAAMQGATAWPTAPETPRLLEALAEEVALALEGRKSPQEALNAAQERWLAILGQGPAPPPAESSQ